MYSAISLFSGMEGFGLALEQYGIRVRAQVEIEAWKRKLLALRFPHSQIFEDVCNVGSSNLKQADVICGGFPCQDISAAGLRAGIAGERSGLWYEFARIVGELRPAIVFMENADEITAPIRERGTGRVIDRAPGYYVLASLAEMGFDAQWGIVPASATGAPHKRDRWWCVAWNVSNANEIRRRRSEKAAKELSHHQFGDTALRSAERSAIVHAVGTSDLGVALGDTNQVSLQAQRAVWEQGAPARSGSHESEGSDRGTRQDYSDQPDLGRIVFDGLSGRLDRFARTQLWAAPLGVEPFPFEPSRLADDMYDWTDRVQAVGDAVCVPVVCAFAEGIRQALDALYA